MTLAIGEVYVPESAAEVRTDILNDVRLEAAKHGVDLAYQPGTDTYIWATAVANAAMLQYANLAGVRDNITPLYATGADLENWRIALGLIEVKASQATGKIKPDITGTASISEGTQFTLPNGLRGRVAATYVAITDGAEVDVALIDAGEDGNLAGGEEVTFVNPPVNVAAKATVSLSVPLTGGTDTEDEPRKRTRILNRLRNTPGGGNWGHVRELGLEARASLQDVFVYPALGGAGSLKAALVSGFDRDNNNYSRALSAAAVSLVRDYIQSNMPSPMEIVVQSVADELVDIAINVTIPDSILGGGNGLGWSDLTPWPQLEGADNGRVTVSAVTSSTQITVSANTATSPVAGQTHIAWWAPGDQRFRTFLVTAVSGTAGAWVLTLDKPAVDTDGTSIATGSFISPAAERLDRYGASWLALMEGLGAGENTTDTDRVPRAKRHPFVSDEAFSALTALQLKRLMDGFEEITDTSYAYRSVTSPTVPASVDDAPNVLTPRHLGIYKL
jgi:uncharacterized phage protein gp47/JayE